jgi:hypothetical protein
MKRQKQFSRTESPLLGCAASKSRPIRKRRSPVPLRLTWRIPRRMMVLRRPVRITVYLARRFSLSVCVRGWTVNVNSAGLDLRVAPAPGWTYRRLLYRWPWRTARR